MKKYLFIFFVIFSALLYSQSVIQTKYPTETQKKLIDKLIEVSGYNDSLMKTANLLLFRKSMQHENGKNFEILNTEEKKIILNRIRHNYSEKDKLYFDFMNLTEKNLMNLIQFYDENPNLKSSNYIFSSDIIIHNLDNEISHEVNKILKEKSTQ
ncbi:MULTISPECIES: hypothetical protein [unclassified Chryseobacterium]|uniref:hypothetical protein n=1 Tax=unclassified Chryseobacterium TaxID=2593645 RepID=UPI001AEA75EC|nr:MULTISPECIES: hypothetical protein [unclassified Chryseobacterium]MBP1166166.1 hypothetical protein [Chryseobacterium sp. PvR013]MDR4891347.1 hypothetical protein [Chryseobacterium sp. CFS7]